VNNTASLAERAKNLTMENTMKHLPISLAGALLVVGSMAVYAQTQPLPEADRPASNEQTQSGQPERQKGQENQRGEQSDKGKPAGEGTGKQGRDQGNSGETGSSSQEDKRAQNTQPERPKGQENQRGDQNDKDGKPAGEGTGKQGRDQGNSGGTGSSSQEDKRAEQTGDRSKDQSQKRHAGKKLEAKQRTVVRESIGKRHMRPAKVNFSINVGTVIPRTVELYDLPETLIEYEPSYSRYKFVMSDDNTILVIDPETWTIIDVIEI
jgi:hypothetical protein